MQRHQKRKYYRPRSGMHEFRTTNGARCFRIDWSQPHRSGKKTWHQLSPNALQGQNPRASLNYLHVSFAALRSNQQVDYFRAPFALASWTLTPSKIPLKAEVFYMSASPHFSRISKLNYFRSTFALADWTLTSLKIPLWALVYMSASYNHEYLAFSGFFFWLVKFCMGFIQ